MLCLTPERNRPYCLLLRDDSVPMFCMCGGEVDRHICWPVAGPGQPCIQAACSESGLLISCVTLADH